MIIFQQTEVMGWEAALRGMRNPMNSWAKRDTVLCSEVVCRDCPALHVSENNEPMCGLIEYTGSDTFSDFPSDRYLIGPNDHELAMKLAAGGSVHAKYRRMITVYVDIIAPLYWWKEFDTYKVGTVANSCSTMHKIADREFSREDFSCEHLGDDEKRFLDATITFLEVNRKKYIETKDKEYWWQMIQLLPSSYNQMRTVMLNYEVLAGLYPARKDHKLDEWRNFCEWIENLPYSEFITGVKHEYRV